MDMKIITVLVVMSLPALIFRGSSVDYVITLNYIANLMHNS